MATGAITTDQAWHEGHAAYRAGKSGSRKPYPTTTPQGEAWVDGWLAAQGERAEAERNGTWDTPASEVSATAAGNPGASAEGVYLPTSPAGNGHPAGPFSQHKEAEMARANAKQGESDLPNIETDGLQADITGWLVDRLRHQEKPYAEMSEAEQREVIESAQKATADLLREVVKKIAADERKVIQADLKNVTRDADKIVGKLECPKSSEYRHDLFDATGRTVLIVVADADEYMGGEMPEADADQKTIDDYAKQSAHQAEDAAA